MTSRKDELLGAHVSTAGGVHKAPSRAKAIGATVMQVFTKTPNQWREPIIAPDVAQQFRDELNAHGIRAVMSHDSYLINLASPDPELRQRSMQCFVGELSRCHTLGIPFVVTHPGNFIDHRKAGLLRNARAYAECLRAVPTVKILLETTAGTGTALGATFEELADLRDKIPATRRARVGFCADLCHLYAAGYDVVNDWKGIWREWDRVIGLQHLYCLHLNDSKTPLGSHRDRHELIGEGTLGPEPFRRVMRDPRFRRVIKIIETPKRDDVVKPDRRMLRRLRAYGIRRRPAPVGPERIRHV